MNIYLIERTENTWYDEYLGHVIVANNEDEVRKLARNEASDEGEDAWDTPPISCVGTYTGTQVEPFILLSSYRAG